MDTFYLLRFRLGRGTFWYLENPQLKELFKTSMNEDAQWNETFNPRNQDIWMIIPNGRPFEKYFPDSMLKEAIESMIRDEQFHLVQLRRQALSTLEFRPIQVRIPSGEPEIRIKSVARMYSVGVKFPCLIRAPC